MILWIVMMTAYSIAFWIWGYRQGQKSREDFIQGLATELERSTREIKWLGDTNALLEQENHHLKQIEVKKIVHEEHREIRKIRANVRFDSRMLSERPDRCAERAKEQLRRELSKMVLTASKLSFHMDDFTDAAVFEAELQILPHRNYQSLEDLIRDSSTKERRRGGNNLAFAVCGGNPGATSFFVDACKKDPLAAEGFQKMLEADITAEKLYMFWNDCCDRNTEMAIHIMLNCPVEKIWEHINYEHGRGIPFTEYGEKVEE